MRFLFNGLSLFGKRMVHDLSVFAPGHSYHYFDTYFSKKDQLKFAALLPFSDLVVSMNGVSDKSGSFDLVMALKKKLLLLWQGTDVLHATERTAAKTINRKYIDYAANYAVAPWLQQELQAMHVPCGVLTPNWFEVKNADGPFKSPAAYTYLPEGKEDFYGWPVIAYLCRENPGVRFYIAGTNGSKLEKLSNMIFMGWSSQEKMTALSMETPVYLRFTVHDGFPHSVTQALACGNEIIWSIPFSHSHYATEKITAGEVFKNVMLDLKDNKLRRNEENIHYAKETFNREKVLTDFLKTITEVAGR